MKEMETGSELMQASGTTVNPVTTDDNVDIDDNERPDNPWGNAKPGNVWE